jgi:hypothetical protein
MGAKKGVELNAATSRDSHPLDQQHEPTRMVSVALPSILNPAYFMQVGVSEV